MKSYIEHISPYVLAKNTFWDIRQEKQNNIFKLDWNESTIPPSPKVIETITELLKDDSIYCYYPNTNNRRLIASLANYLNVHEDEVQYFPSSDTLHEIITRCWLNKDDCVAILWPSYDNFRFSAEITGARIIYAEMENLTYTKKVMYDVLDCYKPRLAYLCNPNNPTGCLIPKDDIIHFLKLFPDTMFIIDEAYAEYSGQSVSDQIREFDNLLITRTFSKAFGIANLRIGYAVSSAVNIQTISKLRNPKNISTISQEAAIAALEDKEYMFACVEEVRRAKTEFCYRLTNAPGVKQVYPSHGNYVLIEFKCKKTRNRIVQRLSNYNIFVRELSQSEKLLQCIRITIGTRDQMRYVASRMIEILNDENSLI